MHRLVRMALLLLAAVATIAGRAQGEGDPSLTKDFPKLSPKERSRIAAKETAEAEQDQVYQAVMHEAERAFQEGRYEEALASYEKARLQRPYNVYPKVKIQDLKALLKQKEQEQPPVSAPPPAPDTTAVQGAGPNTTPADVPAAITAPASVPSASPGGPSAAPVPKPSPVPAGTTERAVRAASTQPRAVPSTQPVAKPGPGPATERLAVPATGGTTERRYQDGHAWVIERTIVVEGRSVVYKRVAHPFGQVYYFEDGIAVDERVWNERFP